MPASSRPVEGLEDAIRSLEERLGRYPRRRYPVQHATVQFHLGVALANAGRLSEADLALGTAAELFHDVMPIEHAKTLNARGAVLRLQGRFHDAVEVFRLAGEVFGAAERPREEAAALFNLGLAERDLGDLQAAAATFRRAAELFPPADVPARAAAARELGATLLGDGELEQASDVLGDAVRLSQEIGDQVGIGAATNVLGLVYLASERLEDAVDAFRNAAAANPRSLRPHDYAMAKANLALAYGELGRRAHSRLAAGQALGVQGLPEAVATQAAGILDRFGPAAGAALPVLETEPLDRWPTILREESARWLDLAADERCADIAVWITAMLTSERAEDLGEAWLGALLELTPDKTELLIRSSLEAVAQQPPEVQAAFRALIARAMARFHLPQWERLKDLFNRMATEVGQEPSWS